MLKTFFARRAARAAHVAACEQYARDVDALYWRLADAQRAASRAGDAPLANRLFRASGRLLDAMGAARNGDITGARCGVYTAREYMRGY